ncbi:MAG: GTP 3',8-cyclase MoaA [Alphaproteobacteria bacterium]|nr:GTP 3',8-cyclase MoaA [Alphaproteobacteria bacterium]
MPATPEVATPLIDAHGRTVSYLRLSVTDRCDLRCSYCMPERMKFLPKKDILSLEELETVAGIFIDLGVRKIRLTGGEPLMRKNIMHLIKALGRRLDGGGLNELSLSTNATQLARFAEPLAEAGVQRVNVSLDSLRPERYAEITRWGKLDAVLHGLEAAKRAGLKIKINCVVLKSFNEDEVDDLLRWCAMEDFDLVFIEVMPMGDLGAQTRFEQFLSLQKLEEKIDADWGLIALPDNTGGPSRYYRVQRLGSRIGFISPLSHRFCALCNRVRLTCTGTLFTCLGQEGNKDLRAPLRSPHDPITATREAIFAALASKPEGHVFLIQKDRVQETNRHMNTTGG